MVRTEDEITTKAPIAVTLGGEEYNVAPLVIAKSRPWRAKFSKALGSLSQYSETTAEDGELFGEAINAMLVGMPDQVIDLFFDYATDLPREKIENAATDTEMAKAFEQVIEIAFPLAGSMVGTMTKMGAKEKDSP